MKFNINMGDGVAFDITGKDVLRTAMKMSDAYPGETVMVFAMDVCRLQVLDGEVIDDQKDIHPFHDLSHYSPLVQMAIEVQWREMITADIRAKYKLTDMHGARGSAVPVSMAPWDDLYNELSLKFPFGCGLGNMIIGHDNEMLVARPDGDPVQFVMGPPAGYYDGARKLDSEIDFELDWNAITGNAPADGGVHDASVTMHHELNKQRPASDSAIPVNWDFLDKAPMLMPPTGNQHPIGGHIDIEDRELRNPPTVAGEHYEGEATRVETAEDRKRRFLIHGPEGAAKPTDDYTAEERREMGLPPLLTGAYNEGRPGYVPDDKKKE